LRVFGTMGHFFPNEPYVRWASEPVDKSKPPGFDGLGGPSYKPFPNDSQPLSGEFEN